MSDYRHEKVLRVPCDKYDLPHHLDLEDMHPDLFSGQPGFHVAPTEGDFIDYCLFSKIDGDGDWGKIRPLTENEKQKYLPIFRQLIPDINMDDVHLVEYCWYDCSEAPDYYSMDAAVDDFYKEV